MIDNCDIVGNLICWIPTLKIKKKKVGSRILIRFSIQLTGYLASIQSWVWLSGFWADINMCTWSLLSPRFRNLKLPKLCACCVYLCGTSRPNTARGRNGTKSRAIPRAPAFPHTAFLSNHRHRLSIQRRKNGFLFWWYLRKFSRHPCDFRWPDQH